MRHIAILACFAATLLPYGAVQAQDASHDSLADSNELSLRIEELKLQSVNIARDLALLERELGDGLGRVIVFVSLDPRLGDEIEQIELKLGDETVAEHRYSPSENAALVKGGAHRLYAGNIELGRHVLEANLSARGNAGRLRQSAKLSFRSELSPKTIELRLQATEPGLAELTVREWD